MRPFLLISEMLVAPFQKNWLSKMWRDLVSLANRVKGVAKELQGFEHSEELKAAENLRAQASSPKTSSDGSGVGSKSPLGTLEVAASFAVGAVLGPPTAMPHIEIITIDSRLVSDSAPLSICSPYLVLVYHPETEER